MSELASSIAEVTMTMSERALVFDIVRYLDRVAFVPRDLVLAHASGRVGADVFDRFRTTAERTIGPIREPIWIAVLAELAARATSTSTSTSATATAR